ncbi:MAG: hypothetical protein ABIH18_09370 [Candidatus Omnitrophota bacterium]
MVKKITARSFKPYGWVIEYLNKDSKSPKNNLFRIVLREKEKTGWRIAYLIVRDKNFNKLEQHIDSFESFEPVKGRSLIYLAKSKQADKIECFYLDKPVILKKNIWHAVVTKSRESEIKITENAKVKCGYWVLER